MIRRTTLVALLLAAAACGGDSGGDDDNKQDSGSNDGGGGGGTNDGGGAKPDAGGADAATPPKPDQVTNAGAACTNKSACEGDNPTCLTSVSVVLDSINFPGGYCSAPCKADIECGSGECPVAVSLSSGLGALGGLGGGFDIGALLPSHCYERCTDSSSCRTSEGYRCTTIIEALASGAGAGAQLGNLSALLSGPIKDNKYCLPPAPVVPDAGTPDAGGGTPDAGTPDAGGSTPDAGAPDANTNDV